MSTFSNLNGQYKHVLIYTISHALASTYHDSQQARKGSTMQFDQLPSPYQSYAAKRHMWISLTIWKQRCHQEFHLLSLVFFDQFKIPMALDSPKRGQVHHLQFFLIGRRESPHLVTKVWLSMLHLETSTQKSPRQLVKEQAHLQIIGASHQRH